jgi:hypothetical protein
MNNLEERIRLIETQLAFWKGACTVGAFCILAWSGVTTWVTVPAQVRTQLASVVGEDVQRNAKAINDEYLRITNNKSETAKALGIPELQRNLVKQSEWLLRVYKAANEHTPGTTEASMNWQRELSDALRKIKDEIK